MAATPNVLDRFRDPLADPPRDRKRLRMASMLIVMGVLHFVVPGPFERIIPRWFPWRRPAVLWSGVAELASGVLLAVPSTQRAGGALATATLIGVYPANIQMAIDSTRGVPQAPMPVWAAWLRLPMQIPMIRTAWSFTR